MILNRGAIIKGSVIRKITGFYYVLEENTNSIYECKLKGSLKKSNNKLNCIFGDIVDIDVNDKIITNIYPRNNFIERPLMANINSICIVQSIKEPDFDILAFEKQLLWTNKNNIETILLLTKIDLVDKQELDDFRKYFSSLFPYIKVFNINNNDNSTIEVFKEYINNSKAVLAGKSGVGKSTLVNKIMKEEILITQEISKKLKKGRNTTVDTRLFNIDKNTFIVDTPGFSVIDYPSLENKKELENLFIEFNILKYNCKFNDCIHDHEPHCAIKEAVEEGIIPKTRYEFYLLALNNIKIERK